MFCGTALTPLTLKEFEPVRVMLKYRYIVRSPG